MSTSGGKSVHGVVLEPRAIIRPKVEVKASTVSQKQEVLKSAQRVITTHRKVLKALRDR